MTSTSIRDKSIKKEPHLEIKFDYLNQKKKGPSVLIKVANLDSELKKYMNYVLRTTYIFFLSRRTLQLNILKYFLNIESIYIHGSYENFPNCRKLENLTIIRMDQRKKPFSISNFDTIPNLKELSINESSYFQPATFENIKDLEKLKSLEILKLYNVKIPKDKARDFIKLKKLKELIIPDWEIHTEDLAFLTAKLNNVVSKDLAPYSQINDFDYNIKVHGKGKPMLVIPKDQDKLDRYVEKFEQMVSKFK